MTTEFQQQLAGGLCNTEAMKAFGQMYNTNGAYEKVSSTVFVARPKSELAAIPNVSVLRPTLFALQYWCHVSILAGLLHLVHLFQPQSADQKEASSSAR